MTMPHLMNCPHQGEGWCLQCVNNLVLETARPPRGFVACSEWVAALGAEADTAIKRSDYAASTGDIRAEEYHDGYADALSDVRERLRRAATV